MNTSTKRIHESLQRVCRQQRLVFWYDGTGEWKETFDSFVHDGVVKLEVGRNEFGIKVRICCEPNLAIRFLIYVPMERPSDNDNWLLDLVLQGYEYKADKASLALQEVGLSYDFLHVAEEHEKFFQSDSRVKALKELIVKDDQDRELRLKMMAVLASAEDDIDLLLLHFLTQGADEPLFDPVAESLESFSLLEYFWREVARAFAYNTDVPSLRDFAVAIFRGANPLDKYVPLHPHAKVFLQRWKDSQTYRGSYHRWAFLMEKELRVAEALNEQGNADLGDCDTFEIFEKFCIHRLCHNFAENAAALELRSSIQQRRSSFWYSQHAHGYAAVEQAVELREALASADLTVESTSAGASRYKASWWRIDMAYRMCVWNLRRYGQVQVMQQITQWADRSYVNNFLLPLADRWSDQVRRLERWECSDLPSQSRFFQNYVQPFVAKGLKVFVIISDGLRYEAAADFAQRIQSANRWTAEVEGLFGSLPSYTQLGMASLLPGKERVLDSSSGNVTVDGRSSVGVENRTEILHAGAGAKTTAIRAEDFLNLNTMTDGRTLMREHEVVYIFHDTIDKTGHTLSTEGKTFDAVETAFDELEQIIKKVANINGSNMLLTTDHGFLFQQNEIDDSDVTPLPSASELCYRDRRFVIGKGIEATPNVKIFDGAALGLGGDWSAAFPLSIGRFPLQGSGKRYVHGGISLQEVILPVVKIHKARTDDTGKVEVELLRVPTKITTGQISVALFQDRPAVGKILPRTLRIGLFAKDGTSLSEAKTITFDYNDDEARLRETSVVLALSHAADAFNNSEVDLRLEETVQGTNQIVTYKTHSLKLQKPFASDFDE